MSKVEIRHTLLDKLKAENYFWSYDSSSWDKATDEQLIEKTMVYLDLPEIELLFELYGYKMVKQVWLHKMVPQGEYLYTLNRFFAWYYFHAKNPEYNVTAKEIEDYIRCILNR